MSDVSLDLVRREITSRSRGDSRDGLDDDIARDFPFLDHARPSTRFTLAYLLFPEKKPSRNAAAGTSLSRRARANGVMQES